MSSPKIINLRIENYDIKLLAICGKITGRDCAGEKEEKQYEKQNKAAVVRGPSL